MKRNEDNHEDMEERLHPKMLLCDSFDAKLKYGAVTLWHNGKLLAQVFLQQKSLTAENSAFLMCLGSVLTTWSTRPSKENPDPLDEACRMHCWQVQGGKLYVDTSCLHNSVPH